MGLFNCLFLLLGLVGNDFLGPVELPTHWNGENFLVFLEKTLPGLLDNIPLITKQALWFMHDGCAVEDQLPSQQGPLT